MIFHLFRRTPRNDSIASLYGTIVAQARAPAFYQIYGVPDTVNGRLEMIVLHAVLLLARLESEAAPVRAPRPGAVRCLLPRHGRQPARDGGRRSGRAPPDARDRRGILRPAGGIPGGARRARPRAACRDPGPQCICRRARAGWRGPARRLCAATVRELAAQDAGALGRAQVAFPDAPRQVPAAEPQDDDNDQA